MLTQIFNAATAGFYTPDGGLADPQAPIYAWFWLARTLLKLMGL